MLCIMLTQSYTRSTLTVEQVIMSLVVKTVISSLLCTGVYDSSGMMYHYTRQRPKHVAGYLGLESTFFRMVIPPLAEQYSLTGLCSSNCTEEVRQLKLQSIVVQVVDIVLCSF